MSGAATQSLKLRKLRQLKVDQAAFVRASAISALARREDELGQARDYLAAVLADGGTELERMIEEASTISDPHSRYIAVQLTFRRQREMEDYARYKCREAVTARDAAQEHLQMANATLQKVTGQFDAADLMSQRIMTAEARREEARVEEHAQDEFAAKAFSQGLEMGGAR